MKDKKAIAVNKLLETIRDQGARLETALIIHQSDLKEPKTGESADFQPTRVGLILKLQQKQNDDIRRLYTMIHGGGTGKD